MTDTKKVVVVGAGPCGRMVVKQLKGKGCHVTLVQAAKTSELSWYICEALTGQKAYEQASTSVPIPSADKIVYGVATGVCDGKVAVETPEGSIEELTFDALVCATGIVMPTFTAVPGQDVAERKQEIADLARLLTNPKRSIVIAGGGAVGVEIAGDILDGGNKNITLVTPSNRLLLDQDEKWSKKALAQLESRGVKVVFGERCSSHSELTIAESGSKLTVTTTRTSKTIECDIYLPAHARGPQSAWLSKAIGDSKLPDSLLNETGHVAVDEYLASKVYPNLYVIGGCSALDEPTLAPNFDSQSQCIAKNIVREKSAKYGGGVLRKPMMQLVGHETYGFFVPEAMNVPSCCSSLMCTICGFPGNLLCPCVWCGILCGPCNVYTCGMCCSDAEGKGVPQTLTGAGEMGLTANMAGFDGLGKVAPTNAEMER